MHGKLHITCGELHQAVSAGKFKLKKECGPVQPAQAITQVQHPFWNLERETSLELATSTLARLRSTN